MKPIAKTKQCWAWRYVLLIPALREAEADRTLGVQGPPGRHSKCLPGLPRGDSTSPKPKPNPTQPNLTQTTPNQTKRSNNEKPMKMKEKKEENKPKTKNKATRGTQTLLFIHLSLRNSNLPFHSLVKVFTEKGRDNLNK